jgi:hypothetical protein
MSLALILVSLSLSIVHFKKHRAKISLGLAGGALLITSLLTASHRENLVALGLTLVAFAAIWSVFPQLRSILVYMHRTYQKISRG